MQTSTIKFSQIEDRIDAGYYKPEYLILENALNKNPGLKTLREISAKIVDGPFGSDLLKSEYISGGIPLLRVQNITGEGINTDNLVFINSEKQIELERSRVFAGDLVITKAGRVGTVDVVPSSIPEANITSHLAKISLKKEYNPYFVYMYLNSRLGLLQIERQGIKSTKPELNIDEVAITKIIIPPQSFQRRIEEIVKEAQEKRKLADEKYKEAEEILNKELGLEGLNLSTQKTFEAKFSEAEDRFDPEYYQPKYKKIKTFLSNKKLTTKPLKSFVKKYNCGFAFPTETYLEKGIPLLRIKNLKRIEIDFEGVEFLPNLDEYQEFVAKSGDILISMSGTVGAVSLVPKNIQKAFVNQRITSISTEGIDKLYLCLYLNLPAINSLVVKKTTGGVQKNITYQDIISVPVPILSQFLQQKISSLIQESFKLRQEAKELIDRAKKEVEEMVEGGNI